MAEDKNLVEENLTGLDKLQNTYENHATAINAGVIGILLVILGFLVYNSWWMPKQELAAKNAIFQAQHYFEQDSFQKSLDNGILMVANKYGSTNTGNLAKYYAGAAYYNLGDYANSAKFLSKYCTCKDGVIGGIALSTLADAQMELGETSKALKNYAKSATLSDNEASAPVLLLKAGLAHELNGKYAEAKKFYQEIKTDFPNSTEATDVEKYLGRVEASL